MTETTARTATAPTSPAPSADALPARLAGATVVLDQVVPRRSPGPRSSAPARS